MYEQAQSAIEASGLGKRFGDLWALRDVDLHVPAGTVLGLLGHNGAGKTTAVRILTTLAAPTEGTARVAGHDVVADPLAVKRSIGLAGQSATVDGLLTGLHEPEASHLNLLDAVAGEQLVDRAYEALVQGEYLWHEFGDSTLLLP